MKRMLSIILWLTLPAAALAQQPGPAFLGRTMAQYEADLNSPSAPSRHLSAWSLAQLGAPAESALHSALAHDDPTVRYWAAFGLARIAAAAPAESPRRKKAAQALAPLLSDAAAAPKLAAAEALVRLEQREEALQTLIRGLSDPQEAARIAAIDALARLGPLAAAARPAIEQATGDSSEYVKRIAARILSKTGR